MRTRNKNRRTVKERNNPTDAFCDIHSDEKLTVETSAGETLLSVQFTLSTQIKSNCLVIPPPPSEVALQSRRDFGERVFSIFLTKIMAAIVDFKGSGRLERERNLY